MWSSSIAIGDWDLIGVKVKLSGYWASASLIIMIHTTYWASIRWGTRPPWSLRSDERANSVLQIQKISIIAIDSHYPLKKGGEKKKRNLAPKALAFARCNRLRVTRYYTYPQWRSKPRLYQSIFHHHYHYHNYHHPLSPIARIKQNKPDR